MVLIVGGKITGKNVNKWAENTGGKSEMDGLLETGHKTEKIAKKEV